MAKRARKRPDISTWLTPKAALEIATAAMGDYAAKTVMDKLEAGFIRAWATQYSKAIYGYRPTTIDKPTAIVPELWPLRQSELFWQTGSVEFRTMSFSTEPTETIWCLDIRFEPVAFRKTFPPAVTNVVPKERAKTEATSASTTPTGASRPLASAALKAWYEAYKLAYSDSERNLDHAWDHAKRAFPEKTVTRAALRDLMAGGKRGPRAKN